MSYEQEFTDYIADFGYEPLRSIRESAGWERLKFAGERASSGSYKLEVRPDGTASAVFGSSKDAWRSWKSKSAKKLTVAERKELDRQLKAERQAREEATRVRQQRMSRLVAKALRGYPVAATHPYLDRKQIAAHGVKWRRKGNELLIPMYQPDGKAWSLQRITAAGWKGFIGGGRIIGGYYPIMTQGGSKDVICICEGFSTGASIHQATGLPVVVTFTAGNLLSVARDMRLRYSDAVLVICADNDQWSFIGVKKPREIDVGALAGDDPRWPQWREEGRLYNTGVEKGKEAAMAVGGLLCVPVISADDARRRTDFNDLMVTDGAECVKEMVMAVVDTSRRIPVSDQRDDAGVQNADGDSYDWASDLVIPISAYEDPDARHEVSLYAAGEVEDDESWRERLEYDVKSGKLKPRSLQNAVLMIEHDPLISKMFCYDEFSHEKVVYRCPPWEDVSRFKPRIVKDDDVTRLTIELERRGIQQPFQNVGRLLNASIKKNTRNPAIEYFNGLEWDGKARLDTWLLDYCGCIWDDAEYVSAVGRKWLTAAVARVFEPGCEFVHMLVLEGPQNAGKSKVLRNLATLHGKPYFDDTIKISQIAKPETIAKYQGVLIVEISEMTGVKQTDTSELKQFLGVRADRIVRKYENEATYYPRQFVFAGTINPSGKGYLQDETGNRRFWPVRVAEKIDHEGIDRQKYQLWAEAVVRYKEGEILTLEGDLYRTAMQEQEKRRTMHPWQPDIETAVGTRARVGMTELWDALNMTQRVHRTKQAADDIGKIMTGLGYEHKRLRINGGSPEWGWAKRVVDEDVA